jgi:hypothetical protein
MYVVLVVLFLFQFICLTAYMHKCHLTADCEIGNQTNRIVYLNIDLAIEIEM